jgi:hypothetical protein
VEYHLLAVPQNRTIFVLAVAQNRSIHSLGMEKNRPILPLVVEKDLRNQFGWVVEPGIVDCDYRVVFNADY